MKMLFSRDQRSGLTGKVVFVLDVRADISEAEKTSIAKYKLADTRLYEKYEVPGAKGPGAYMGILGVAGFAARMAARAMNITLDVKDLTSGKRIECKDIVEMLAVEEQVKDAARTFAAILEAAQHFGGEEVMEL